MPSKPLSSTMYQPYKRHRYPLFRIHGSIIDDIAVGVVVATAWSVLITGLYMLAKVNLAIPPQIITILSLVTSLILAFRTNTAYERFNEARRVWGVLHYTIRNMTRLIWVHAKEVDGTDLIEKRTVLNLLAAFAISMKHYVRCEYGTEHDDLKPLLGNFPKFSGAFIDAEIKKAKKNYAHIRIPRQTTELAHNSQATPDNIPLQITFFFSQYINYQNRKTYIDVPTTNGMALQVTVMVECLTTFERILRTPMPFAYSIQLSQTIWIYLIALPFQLVSSFNWLTVLVVLITAFALLGFESIGQEIENPFGYDTNDLPLDEFCEVVCREIDLVASVPAPDMEQWIFSEQNVPFKTKDVSAIKLKEWTMDELRTAFLEEVHAKSSNTHGRSRSEFTVVALGNESVPAKSESTSVEVIELEQH